MAAYLGAGRALASGVGPWEPPEPAVARYGEWAASHFMKFAPLSLRERVWLTVLCAEHAVLAHWKGGPGPARAIDVARAWCSGRSSNRELREAHHAISTAPLVPPQRLDVELDPATCAASAASLATGLAVWGSDAERVGFSVAALALCVEAFQDHDAQHGWQAEAISAALLDPSWPPWSE